MNIEAIKVHVRYPAAGEPFKDHSADPDETVGSLRARVMAAFGLEDAGTPEGNQITYVLYFEKRKLENPDETLRELHKGGGVLQLKLSQEIIQGAG